MAKTLTIIAGNKLYVRSDKGISEIDLIKAAYLLYHNKAIAIDENGKNISLRDLFMRYGDKEEWWILFSVFTDLAKRGFKVEKGYSSRDLIALKGDKKYRIFVTEEGMKIKLSYLYTWIEGTQVKDLDVLIAVVDMYGDITYYQVFPYTFQKQLK